MEKEILFDMFNEQLIFLQRYVKLLLDYKLNQELDVFMIEYEKLTKEVVKAGMNNIPALQRIINRL
jgi:hypothetical protein